MPIRRVKLVASRVGKLLGKADAGNCGIID